MAADSEEQVFGRALAIENLQQRQRYLEEACAGDSSLLKRVQVLLEAAGQPDSFLESPAALLAPTFIPQNVLERSGMQIGPYKLLEQIGEGGFGVVFMAEQQQPVRRKVALKVIKPGMDSRQVIARFEAERQALALMDHPNIARVFDAGETESGRPYFVMELVRGIPITQFCDDAQFTTRERLDLFVSVCNAAQHAHQKGIIHRDLKPSNVLVTLHDGTPTVKVIDFGVAKATGQQLTEKTLFTGFAQMVGTPLYMSPEQAALSGLDIDTRSDVYSLGVLLYELLTGTTPLTRERLQSAAFDEVRRLIREEEAIRPSTRVSSLGQSASSISALRRTEPARLSQLLRNELDWITLKALEKDRTRRYESASAFAADLQRFLKDEPVEACPPSTAYRLRKFYRRHRVAITVGLVVAVSLVIGLCTSLWFGMEAAFQKEEAILFAAEADQARSEEAKQRRIAEKQQAEAEHQRDESTRLRDEAIDLTDNLKRLNEEQRRSLYIADMNLIQLEFGRGNLSRIREILESYLPVNGEPDLRGPEWNYWYRTLTPATAVRDDSGIDSDGVSRGSRMLPGGSVVVVNRDGKAEFRAVGSGRLMCEFQVPARLWAQRNPPSTTGRLILGEADSIHYSAVDGNPRAPNAVSKSCRVIGPDGLEIVLEYPSKSFREVLCLAVSADGKRAAVLGKDSSHSTSSPASRLIVWNLDDKAVLMNYVYGREINRIVLNPEGTQAAAFIRYGSLSGEDKFRDAVVVIETSTAAEKAVLSYNDEAEFVFWVPGKAELLIGTAGAGGHRRSELIRWNPVDNRVSPLFSSTMPALVLSAVNGTQQPVVVLSPDGQFLAITSADSRAVRLINTADGQIFKTLFSDQEVMQDITFAEDSGQVLACTDRGRVLSWNLTEDRDLFGLKSNPLPASFSRSRYVLDRNHNILAVAFNNERLVVRTREGDEMVLAEGFEDRRIAKVLLAISQDSRYLALCSERSANGTVEELTNRLEVYDLRTGKRLWQTRIEGRLWLRNVASTQAALREQQLEYTPDGQHLVFRTHGFSYVVLKTRTGELLTPEPTKSDRNLLTTGAVVDHANNRILLAGLQVASSSIPIGPSDPSEVFLLDPVTGGRLLSSKHPKLLRGEERNPSPGMVVPCPDGRHLGIQRGRQRLVEVWDLKSGERTLSLNGDRLQFSADGRKVAVMELELRTNRPFAITSDRVSVNRVTVCDLNDANRRCEVTLPGRPAEQLDFNPDGSRLLTLHGMSPETDAGVGAEGILWEISTNVGREVLAIPVADISSIGWELDFHEEGDQLSLIHFGQRTSQGGSGYVSTIDLSPLAEEVDRRLMANFVLAQLREWSPIPDEQREQLKHWSALPPDVLKLLEEEISAENVQTAELINVCGTILANPFVPQADAERALRWIQTLSRIEPQNPEVTLLLAGGLIRCGRSEESLRYLSKRPTERGVLHSRASYQREVDRLMWLIEAQSELNADLKTICSTYFELRSTMLLSTRVGVRGWSPSDRNRYSLIHADFVRTVPAHAKILSALIPVRDLAVGLCETSPIEIAWGISIERCLPASRLVQQTLRKGREVLFASLQ